jgi:hypothetical protein
MWAEMSSLILFASTAMAVRSPLQIAAPNNAAIASSCGVKAF